MFTTLPKDPEQFIQWNWSQIRPYVDDLAAGQLTADNVEAWGMAWPDLNRMLSEIFARLWVATTLDTANQQAKNRFNAFLDGIYPASQAANQMLKRKLLASGLAPAGFELALRNIGVEVEIYREQNLVLLTEEKKLINEYDEMIGAQTVVWEGQEVTPAQLKPVYLSSDRAKRQQAWQLMMKRKLADRQQLNELWIKLLKLRSTIASNAGFLDYRAYRWTELLR